MPRSCTICWTWANSYAAEASGEWRSLVARLLWEQDAAGSKPVSPMPKSPVPEGNLTAPRGAVFSCLRKRVWSGCGDVARKTNDPFAASMESTDASRGPCVESDAPTTGGEGCSNQGTTAAAMGWVAPAPPADLQQGGLEAIRQQLRTKMMGQPQMPLTDSQPSPTWKAIGAAASGGNATVDAIRQQTKQQYLKKSKADGRP